jgi:hypothetical protein
MAGIAKFIQAQAINSPEPKTSGPELSAREKVIGYQLLAIGSYRFLQYVNSVQG